MKEFLITFLILIYFAGNIPAAAVSQADTVSKIENDIYGFDYSNDIIQNRISRLEKTVYGNPSSGDINKRINKLSGDISADVIGLEIPPVEDTFAEEETADGSVNYPIVDEIERKLFNQTYQNRDFHSRIVAIERKLFGKIYDVDDYSTRMDRIKAEVMPQKLAELNKTNGQSDSGIIYDPEKYKSSRKFKMPFGQRNYTRPYANYGDMTGSASELNYGGDLNDELTELEYETFGVEFSGEDTATRIKRLNSANRAQKSSSKYDSNKFSQRMSTAMEIGAMILMILAIVL